MKFPILGAILQKSANLATCLLLINLTFGAGQCAASSGAACTSDVAKAAIVETDPKEIAFPGCSVSTPICQGGDHGQARRMVAAWSCGSGGVLNWDVFTEASGKWNLLWRPPDDVNGVFGGNLSRKKEHADDLILEEPIYRDSDPMCCPTGGTKRRILRWNESRFVVLNDSAPPPVKPLAQSAPTPTKELRDYFCQEAQDYLEQKAVCGDSLAYFMGSWRGHKCVGLSNMAPIVKWLEPLVAVAAYGGYGGAQGIPIVIDFKYPVTQGVAPPGVYEIERTDYPLINSATGETYKAFRLRQIRLAIQRPPLEWLSYCPSPASGK